MTVSTAGAAWVGGGGVGLVPEVTVTVDEAAVEAALDVVAPGGSGPSSVCGLPHAAITSATAATTPASVARCPDPFM